jgi:hypothetical protein
MKDWFAGFWIIWASLLSATYFTIGINQVILGCRPTREFIVYILLFSAVIAMIGALASAFKIK